jgi:hypothetical protein
MVGVHSLLHAASAAAIAVGAPVGTAVGGVHTSTAARASKSIAERNVLRVTDGSWNHRRIRFLIDRRTGLLKNNVQAVCRGRGKRHANGYRRFVCVVRPIHHRRHEGLYVSYRILPSGRCRIHWLALRRR